MAASEDTRAQALAGDFISPPERLESVETRYEHVRGNSQFALSLFYIDLDALGWDNNQQRNLLVGNQQQFGFEIETQRKWKRVRLTLNHAYTQLEKFEFIDGADTLITAAEFGFGNDLNNWSDHITKLVINYDLTDSWNINGSLRIYWGFPGTEDMAEYVSRLSAEQASRTNLNLDEQFEEQIFLNFGTHYRFNERTSLAANLYNVMGFIDDKYNKRIFTSKNNGYRAEAPAFAISLKTKF